MSWKEQIKEWIENPEVKSIKIISWDNKISCSGDDEGNYEKYKAYPIIEIELKR